MNIKEIIDGLLLADSWLNLRSTNPKYKSRPRLGHHCNINNEDFVLWIEQKLLEHKISFSPIITRSNRVSPRNSVQLTSRVSESLIPFWERWYPEQKKIVPLDLEFTPLSANLWYCGDGGFNSYKGYLSEIRIACQGFTAEERERLSTLLKEQGFKSRTGKQGNVHISKNSIPSFLNWIGPPIVPSFQYKWNYLSYTTKQPRYGRT